MSSSSTSPPNHACSQMEKCMQIAELKGIPASVEGSNFVFSPLSIVAALSLTTAGARGETLEELLSFLGSPDADHLHSASAQLIQAVGGSDSELIISCVNGVWADRSMAISPSFEKIATSIYRAHIEPANFNSEAAHEHKKINDWVEENTRGMIKNLIPEGAINCSTKLVLANALYFKGNWREKFDKSMTENDKFHLLNGNTIQVPFMRSREPQFISTHREFKVLKLPYMIEGGSLQEEDAFSWLLRPTKNEGGSQNSRGFSLLVFLPNERDGLHDLIKRAVSEPNFIDDHAPRSRVIVDRFMVPKFKMSFNFEASDALKELGVKAIFHGSSADLTGFCLESGAERLSVSSIHHKAAIEVDEDGTTAAVATAGVFTPTCVGLRYNDFVADHPFMFAVREDSSGAILFFGHVVNPSIK